MKMITLKNLVHDYITRDDEGNAVGSKRAVNDVSLDVEPGQFIAILGHNGSGKSTLAKHLNALLYPTEGEVWLDGMNTKAEEHLWDIRQEAGMIFQNPDNQIIGQVVEEDVGFGPENMGVPTKEIWERVEESLKAVGMWEYRKKSPNRLSGGQKQRVSIAGVIAMHPKCIIMDEPTAMLDPNGRKDVIRAARALNDVERITIILITHYMEEAIYADKIFVMDKGKIALQGSPEEIFSHVEEMKKLHLDVPQVTLLAHELHKKGVKVPEGILTKEELAKALPDAASLSEKEQAKTDPGKASDSDFEENSKTQSAENGSGEAADQSGLRIEDISFEYERGTAMTVNALDHISLTIPENQFIGLIGHTGSGKSTFVQMLNGLLKPTEGSIYYNGQNIHADNYDRKKLRSEVGLVFQDPEHQLFETDVISDVMFGPRNLGLPEEECRSRALQALQQVGLQEQFYTQSPFDLSGGQKRRAAIAGVLAMHPRILILDEPTAGLDPRGRDEILDLISRMHKELKITVVLVSHSMEDVAKYVDRILVMDHGRIRYDDIPVRVFSHIAELEEMGLAAPQMTYIMQYLHQKGYPVNTNILTVEEGVREILKAV